MVELILITSLVIAIIFFLRRKKEGTDPRLDPLYDPPLEEGHFRPPCKCHSSLQSNGAIIRFRTYFKDVLFDDWPLYCKLIPTYTKILLMNRGDEKLLGIFEGPYWG